MSYIIFDPDNQIDKEIQKCVHEYIIGIGRSHPWREETILRRILHKRLADNRYAYRSSNKKNRIDDLIEIAIKRRVEKTGMSREDVIREAFCLHFDIPFYPDQL